MDLTYLLTMDWAKKYTFYYCCYYYYYYNYCCR